MFLPPESLPFDLAEFVQQSIADWHRSKPAAVPFPQMESAGDFIVAEMNNCLLRQFDGAVALFEADTATEEYRKCIFAALDRWLAEIQRDPTSE
jgi:hypothetical protein